MNIYCIYGTEICNPIQNIVPIPDISLGKQQILYNDQ